MIEKLINGRLIQNMDLIKNIVELWLSFRWSHKIKIKQPLSTITINKDINPKYQNIILEELNIKDLIIDHTITDHVHTICVPNAKLLWKKLGSRFKEINDLAKEGQFDRLSNGDIQVEDVVLEDGEYELRYEKWDLQHEIAVDNDTIIMIDTQITQDLKIEWYARELVRAIQEARKNSNYNVSDRIYLKISWYMSQEILDKFWDYIFNETLATSKPDLIWPDFVGICDVDDGNIDFEIKKI